LESSYPDVVTKSVEVRGPNDRASFRMFTINEASEFFKLPKHFIRQLVLSKTIPSVMAGKKYLINEKLLERFLLNGVDVGYNEPTGFPGR